MRPNELRYATVKIRTKNQPIHRRHKVSIGINCPPIYRARAMKISTRKIVNNRETRVAILTWTMLDQFCRAFSSNIRDAIRTKYHCRTICRPTKRQNTCPLRNWPKLSTRVAFAMRSSRILRIWMSIVAKPVTISVIYRNASISSFILRWRCRYIGHRYTVLHSHRM